MKKEPAGNEDGNGNAAPLSTEELMRQHLQDRNHVLTDEDFSRVQVGTDHIDIENHPILKAQQNEPDA